MEEEIGNLPEKYALPLTLCYLEGKTNTQAAEQLGWPEGSISRRLSRAREMLRSRLVRRGLAMSAALIAAAFAKSAAACPPGELISSTATAGNLLLRGVPLQQLVSSQTAALVVEVAAGITTLGKLSAAMLFAGGSVVLALAVTIWQIESDTGPRGLRIMLRGQPSGCGPSAPAVAVQPSISPPPSEPTTSSPTVVAASSSVAPGTPQ
jgi:hypothetical protein